MAKWYEDPVSMSHVEVYNHTFGRDADVKGAQRYGWSVASSQTRHDRIKRGDKITTKVTYVVRYARTPASKAQADVARAHEGLDAARTRLAYHAAELGAHERRFADTLEGARSGTGDPIKLERALVAAAKGLAAGRERAQTSGHAVRGSVLHARAMHAEAARLRAPAPPPPFDLAGEHARIERDLARHEPLLARDKELVAAQGEVLQSVRDWQAAVGTCWRTQERVARLEAKFEPWGAGAARTAGPGTPEAPGTPVWARASQLLDRALSSLATVVERQADLARQRQEMERHERLVAERQEALERALAARDEAWAALTGTLGDMPAAVANATAVEAAKAR